MFKLFFVLFFTTFVLSASADTPIEEGFQSGTRLYQDAKYQEAAEIFQSLYNSRAETPSLLFNWGLASYKLQKKGLALGLWRRALYLDPDLSSARRAIDYLDGELPREVMSPDTQGFEYLHQKVLNRFTINKLLALNLVLFLVAGYLILRFFIARNRSITNELPLPPTPSTAIFILVLFLACTFLVVSKIVVVNEVRATVTTSTATLRTGPSMEDNTLYELLEGLEVIVENIENTWVQVTLPDGLSGWVPAENLFQHTGREHQW